VTDKNLLIWTSHGEKEIEVIWGWTANQIMMKKIVVVRGCIFY